MKKLIVILLCGMGLSMMSLASSAATSTTNTDSGNMQLAAWWVKYDRTWCDRHPNRCEREFNRRHVKYYKHRTWCENHPKRCTQQRNHARWCANHPGRCN